MSTKAAIHAIEKYGILLVYPIDNHPEPLSLWRCFHPRTPMRWEWDQEGDNRVADLWHLRAELSASGKVVYAKWYRGRATFFSREVFPAMLSILGSSRGARESLGSQAKLILDLLEMDSPLSTKQIKKLTDLRGKPLESIYEKAMKELWQKLLIVGFGEIDDGAFPSLAIGSAQLLFENLWRESLDLTPARAYAILEKRLPENSLFRKHWAKYENQKERSL